MQIQSLSNQYFFENQDNLFYQTSTDSKQEGLETNYDQDLLNEFPSGAAHLKQLVSKRNCESKENSFTRDPCKWKKVNGWMKSWSA